MTVWLLRVGPFPPATRPMPRVSSPNSALWMYPRLASRPTPAWLIPKIPWSRQVDETFGLNIMPRDTAQFGRTCAKTSPEQPYSERTTIVSGDAVETRTRTSCPGVPTRRLNELHGPSFPSLDGVVSQESQAKEVESYIQVLTRRNYKRARNCVTMCCRSSSYSTTVSNCQ